MDKRKGRKTLRQRVAIAEPEHVSYSLDNAAEIFLRVKRANNLKERTLRDYETNLRYFFDWVRDNYGEISVSEIDIIMLRNYVLWCANDKNYYEGHPFKGDSYTGRHGLSPASVNVRIRILRAFFSTLSSEGIIRQNPAQNLSLMRTEEDTVQPLTEDELRRLLRAPDQRYYAQFRDYVIMVLMIDTGMRINEICALEVNDLDLIGRKIVLPAIKNKNRKMRILPISSHTAKLLKQLVKETSEHFHTNHVFVTYYGSPLNEKTVHKAMLKYAEKAKITKRVSPHVLRHNFAKMAALNGMDVFTLQRILGHADISTTRKYVQIDDEDVQRQHNLFSPITYVLKRK